MLSRRFVFAAVVMVTFCTAMLLLSLVLCEQLLMDKILQYPLYGIYHNSHSLESLRSCRILSINRRTRVELAVWIGSTGPWDASPADFRSCKVFFSGDCCKGGPPKSATSVNPQIHLETTTTLFVIITTATVCPSSSSAAVRSGAEHDS